MVTEYWCVCVVVLEAEVKMVGMICSRKTGNKQRQPTDCRLQHGRLGHFSYALYKGSTQNDGTAA